MTDESGVHLLDSLCCSKCQVPKALLLWSQVAVSYSRNVMFAKPFLDAGGGRFVLEGVLLQICLVQWGRAVLRE